MKLKIEFLGYLFCLCPVKEGCATKSEDTIRKDLYAEHINTLTKLLSIAQEKLLREAGFNIDS